ncbi:hypothetical protein D3C72_1952670 [compost metagenome]
MITSSVSLRTKSLLRKSVPRIGIFEAPGRPDMAWRILSCTRPAMTIEPPEGSSTLVEASRLRMPRKVLPGILLMPLPVTTEPS